MKKRIMVGLVAGGLMAAMMPGVTAAANGPANGLVGACGAMGGVVIHDSPEALLCDVPGTFLDTGSSLAGYGFLELCLNAMPPGWLPVVQHESDSYLIGCSDQSR